METRSVFHFEGDDELPTPFVLEPVEEQSGRVVRRGDDVAKEPIDGM